MKDARLRWRVRHRVVASAAVLLAGVATAADLQISPITLEFGPTQQGQGVWLRNSGGGPVDAQVRVLRWSQNDGQETLEPTRELLPTPSFIRIEPGGQQLVRIVRVRPQAPEAELTYRLLIDELPVTRASSAAGTAGSDAEEQAQQQVGLRFLLRYSVPVFVAPTQASPSPSAAPASPALQASWQAGTPTVLSIANSGNRRVRISRLVHEDAGGKRTLLAPGLLGYVLAGKTMQWPLKAGPGLGAGQLKALLDDDENEQTLPMARGRP
ncbi:fimbrial biogenesis chaperone [Ramlibacter humi]|uniref:Molecular chaperone n=1 Tax=Ramlibacter humi TaxID=2530451 RepID=A0A4Z0CCV2_9BURK|nr:fimbria/pilus periplasmic chaperone [Ramlibacter humi]TFZ08772.1 molecular chaperone [Ramlibacter humi]